MIPKHFWKEVTNQREFFDWLGKEMGYKNMEDWYNISPEDVSKYSPLMNLHADSPGN